MLYKEVAQRLLVKVKNIEAINHLFVAMLAKRQQPNGGIITANFVLQGIGQKQGVERSAQNEHMLALNLNTSEMQI